MAGEIRRPNEALTVYSKRSLFLIGKLTLITFLGFPLQIHTVSLELGAVIH